MEETWRSRESIYAEYIKNYHQVCINAECRLVFDEAMPYVGASPNQLMSCSCCVKACIEIKCPYSINCTEPNEQNLDYLYKDEDAVKLKQNQVFNAMPSANWSYKNQNCLLFGLDYTWNGDRQYYFW